MKEDINGIRKEYYDYIIKEKLGNKSDTFKNNFNSKDISPKQNILENGVIYYVTSNQIVFSDLGKNISYNYMFRNEENLLFSYAKTTIEDGKLYIKYAEVFYKEDNVTIKYNCATFTNIENTHCVNEAILFNEKYIKESIYATAFYVVDALDMDLEYINCNPNIEANDDVFKHLRTL